MEAKSVNSLVSILGASEPVSQWEYLTKIVAWNLAQYP